MLITSTLSSFVALFVTTNFVRVSTVIRCYQVVHLQRVNQSWRLAALIFAVAFAHQLRKLPTS